MKDLQRELMEFLKERNWNSLRPADIAKSIAIEASELLEIFQWDAAAEKIYLRIRDEYRRRGK